MAMNYDDYVYCSPLLCVVSLDSILARPGKDGKMLETVVDRFSAELALDRKRAYDTLHGAVNGLPPRQRAVINAIFFLGYRVTDTARLLKVSSAAVIKLRGKALIRLARPLAPVRDILLA